MQNFLMQHAIRVWAALLAVGGRVGSIGAFRRDLVGIPLE